MKVWTPLLINRDPDPAFGLGKKGCAVAVAMRAYVWFLDRPRSSVECQALILTANNESLKLSL